MATTEGKLLVIGEILRFENKPFKAAHLTSITGLARQVVHYHLRQFAEKEYIVKHDKFYVIHDKEGLYDELNDLAHKRQRAELLSTRPEHVFVDPEFTNNVTKFLRVYLSLEEFVKQEDPAVAEKWSEPMNETREILKDKTTKVIENYTMFQRYLSTRMRDQALMSARKDILDLDPEQTVKNFFKHFAPTLTPNDVELLQGVVREYTRKEK